MNGMATVKVNVDNFVRAETDRMFTSIQQLGGGVVNRLHHNRGPAPLDDQRVIRTNRDTLYSSAVVDISQSATLTVPDAGERYLSVMVVNQDHYINEIIHESGEHELTVDRFDTDYVAIAARILADPNDPVDIAAVNDLQDQFRLTAAAGRPFVPTGYDTASLDATREALLSLARGIDGFARSFGTRALRRRRPTQHHPDHGRLELRSTPLPAPPGNTRPDLDLPHRHAECERTSGRTWIVTNLRGEST
jgi:hypothetical protein